MYNVDHFREQYSRLKSECQKMVPVIGSGKFLTTPIITDDGQPIEESANGNISNNGGDANHATSDKKVIQWKLFLHQIGIYLLYVLQIYILWISCDPKIQPTLYHLIKSQFSVVFTLLGVAFCKMINKCPLTD